MVDYQSQLQILKEENAKTAPATIPTVSILSKKEIFYMLKPDCKEYRSQVLRDFFTPDRLDRLGIDPAAYPTIRQFNFDQSAAIRRELQRLAV